MAEKIGSLLENLNNAGNVIMMLLLGVAGLVGIYYTMDAKIKNVDQSLEQYKRIKAIYEERTDDAINKNSERITALFVEKGEVIAKFKERLNGIEKKVLEIKIVSDFNKMLDGLSLDIKAIKEKMHEKELRDAQIFGD